MQMPKIPVMTKTAKIVILTTLVVTVATATALLTDRPEVSQAASSQVHDTMQLDADQLLQQGVPGVLAQLRTDHDTVTVRSGVGDTTTGRPVPLDAHFRIGSMTKPFVAATILQLVGENRLSLDDTVDRWLPDLVQGNGNDGRAITVRQLLQHTSGLADVTLEMPFLTSETEFQQNRFDQWSMPEEVALALRHAPDFAPGTSWAYSNTNYILAGLIIEKVTGNPWRDEVTNRIIRPLDLQNTTLPDGRVDLPEPHATNYERFPGEDATSEDPQYGNPIDVTEQNTTYGGPAGEMVSTVDDTNRFLQALLGGRVLKPAQLAEMKHTVPTSEGFQQAWPGGRYGLGLMWYSTSCGGAWSHGGDILGSMTRNGVTDDGRRSVVVSINTDSPLPAPDAPTAEHDITQPLIDHALCDAPAGGGSSS
jgi:D-alanyl-D-alanine carboxypeptidase